MMPGSSSEISSQLHGIPIPAPQLLAVAISHTLIDDESIIAMAMRQPQKHRYLESYCRKMGLGIRFGFLVVCVERIF